MEGLNELTRGGAIAPGLQVPALPPHWLRYRDGFVLLQHLFSLTDGRPEAEVDVARLAHDLGLYDQEEREVVRHLQLLGFLHCPGNRASLTWAAIRYLQAERGRRRSVRPRRSPPAPPVPSAGPGPARAAPSSP